MSSDQQQDISTGSFGCLLPRYFTFVLIAPNLEVLQAVPIGTKSPAPDEMICTIGVYVLTPKVNIGGTTLTWFVQDLYTSPVLTGFQKCPVTVAVEPISGEKKRA